MTTAAAPAETTPTPTPDDEFASAFKDAVSEDTPPVVPDASTASPASASPASDSDAAHPPAATPPDADAGDATPPATPPATPAAETPPEESPEAKAARLEAENAELRAKVAAPPPAPPAAPAAPAAAAPAAPAAPASTETTPAAEVEPAWYKPSEEETQALADLEKNWPDIAAAQQIAIKQAVYNAVQYTFAQMQKVYNPQLQRFAELSDVISEQLALSALRGEHEDYDEVYDKVVQWVDTLPAAFKAGAKQTMEKGTPEEVAELISEYKRVHPVAAPAAPAATPTPAAGKTELSATAKQAARKLSVVTGKRTTPIAAPDANDFEGAWAEALKQA